MSTREPGSFSDRIPLTFWQATFIAIALMAVTNVCAFVFPGNVTALIIGWITFVVGLGVISIALKKIRSDGRSDDNGGASKAAPAAPMAAIETSSETSPRSTSDGSQA